MENKPNLFQRILGVMADIHYIQKSEKLVANQYRFVSHDQVTAAIHPLLVKHGIVIIPTVKELKQEGNRSHVILGCCFFNVDDPTQVFEVLSHGFGVDSSDKGPGKAVSYAYKYALLKVFALETGDDPDEDQTTKYEAPKCDDFDEAISTKIEPKMLSKMQDFLAECAESMDKHMEDVKREALTRLPEFIKAFERWKPKGK